MLFLHYLEGLVRQDSHVKLPSDALDVASQSMIHFLPGFLPFRLQFYECLEYHAAGLLDLVWLNGSIFSWWHGSLVRWLNGSISSWWHGSVGVVDCDWPARRVGVTNSLIGGVVRCGCSREKRGPMAVKFGLW